MYTKILFFIFIILVVVLIKNFIFTNETNILNKNNIFKAIILQLFSLIILIFVILYFSNSSKDVGSIFHFGLSTEANPISIFGTVIDTWSKYAIIIFYLILNEILSTWSYKIYKNWYRNRLIEPKSKSVGMSDQQALIVVNLWSFITFVPGLFKYLIVLLTKQIQFLIPGFIARRVISTYVDKQYLKEKKR